MRFASRTEVADLRRSVACIVISIAKRFCQLERVFRRYVGFVVNVDISDKEIKKTI